MAPRGPRGGSSSAGRETRGSALNSKSSSRGGIAKRRGPARIDGDGDLDMGSGAARRSNQTATTSKTNPRPGPRNNNPRGAMKTAETILKHISNGDTSQISTSGRQIKPRNSTTTPLSILRVHGLKDSKAASNKDGGLSDLLSFLERKASALTTRKRRIKIKKVC